MPSSYQLNAVVIRRTSISNTIRYLLPQPAFSSLSCFVFSSFFILAFIPKISPAQVTSSVLSERIARAWTMEKLMQGNKVTANDQTAGRFMLIINSDHTMEQGMYPDGMIKSTWSIDDDRRILSIIDTETNVIYKMKVLVVSDEELVLQDALDPGGITIYYKAR